MTIKLHGFVAWSRTRNLLSDVALAVLFTDDDVLGRCGADIFARADELATSNATLLSNI